MISVIDIIIISVLFLLKPCSISLSQSLYQSIYIHHSYNQKEFDVWVWCLVLVVSHFHCTQTLFSLLPDLTQKHSQHSTRTTQCTNHAVSATVHMRVHYNYTFLKIVFLNLKSNLRSDLFDLPLSMFNYLRIFYVCILHACHLIVSPLSDKARLENTPSQDQVHKYTLYFNHSTVIFPSSQNQS